MFSSFIRSSLIITYYKNNTHNSKYDFYLEFSNHKEMEFIIKKIIDINTKTFDDMYTLYEFLNISELEYIIDKHTNKEEGVRNLKRCIESIISKINIYYGKSVKRNKSKKNLAQNCEQ